MKTIVLRVPAPLTVIFLAAEFCLSACKSSPPPPPEETPSAVIVYEDIKAETPDFISLFFSLEIANPRHAAGRVRAVEWRAEINGQSAPSGFSLEYPSNGEAELPARAASPGAEPAAARIPLIVTMDMPALAALGLAPADDYSVTLIMVPEFVFDGAPPVRLEVSGAAVFPGVRPPEFTITSIAILKAELVNTRFRVGIKIVNPNPFPVELSALSYELYGNGRLWADGAERNILKVNGKSSLEGNLFLMMNFINMKRDLLDQIIRLEDVNYRFAGEAQVQSGVPYLPRFKSGFDLSGFSRVYDN